MRFLLKCAFWLGGVFLLMPGLTGKQTTPPSAPPTAPIQSNTSTAALNKASPDLIEQWVQAGKTLQEISTFCERNPALCTAGKTAAQQAGEQALTRAQTAIEGLANPAITKTSPQMLESNYKIPIPAQRPR
ncbi:DUF5330 domain-containing protein [Pseudochrobactrum sp. MP213Fo]|uniref:DUF5330 domain-containing protein n=1 Tax=Pseudochrobactrum sp. MP213Fo TaxID=3022250 RepID=UPI003B9F4DEE